MAQNATINIKAVDSTRAAFLSVQRNVDSTKRQTSQFSSAWAKGFASMAVSIGGPLVALNMLRGHITSVIRDIDNIPGVSPEAVTSINALKVTFNEVANNARRMTAETIAFFARLPEEAQLAIFALASTTEAAEKARQALQKIREARIQAAKEESPEHQAELKRLRQQIMDERERLARIGETKTDSLEYEKRLQRDLLDMLSQQREGTVEFEKLQLKRLESLSRERKIRLELSKESETAKQAAPALQEVNAFQMSMIKMFDNVGDRSAQLFADMVTTGRASFSELANIVARTMVEITARMAIINPLLNMVFGGVTGFERLPTFFGGPRAMGGPVSTGKSYLVGERGPEIFTPTSAGNIISNEKSTSGGQGGSTYYIDARGADQTGLARLEGLIRQTQASIKPIALGAVMDARMRGGALA